MLLNPFTPSEIASDPNDFFGRAKELRTFERSLRQGSIAIQGPVGIGKSSLLARGILAMEGFGSDHRCKSVTAVGDRDVATVDEAARLLLQEFIHVDERQNRVKFKIGSFFETESAEICKFFVEGKHLAALKRIVEEEYLKLSLAEGEYLILAVDEADKCPVPLARLMRAVLTHTQQRQVKRVRFIFAGVVPFLDEMISEDPGISRFVYETISLRPMLKEESIDLLESKLWRVAAHAKENGIALDIEPTIIPRIVALSGGHPHILQLLGSHLVEHEGDHPDGKVDASDLYDALWRICYKFRGQQYESVIHLLEVNGKLDTLKVILAEARPGFPTRIERKLAERVAADDALQWLVDRNVLSVPSKDFYGLPDEFLRVRLIFDGAKGPQEIKLTERFLIEKASVANRDQLWTEEDFFEELDLSGYGQGDEDFET